MPLPTVTKTWTMSFNNRSVYVSVIRTMGDLMVSLKNFLKTTMGYTLKGSCDGTTGAMDGVDRITNATKWATRANASNAPISWVVFTDGSGVDWCFAFNSSSDASVRLSHSTGGNYAVAGTPTNQPTATDECFVDASGSWINNNTTTRPWDTVWHLWSSSDKKLWRLVTATASAVSIIGQTFCAYIAGETFTPKVTSPASFTLATGGGTSPTTKSYYQGSDGNGGRTFTMTSNMNANYQATTTMDQVRVKVGGVDQNALATHGGEMPGGGVGASHGNAGFFASNTPALQGGKGVLMFPSTIGSLNVSADGKLGNLIDHWFVIPTSTSLPNFLDSYGGLQFWAIVPGVVLVGDGVTQLTNQ